MYTEVSMFLMPPFPAIIIMIHETGAFLFAVALLFADKDLFYISKVKAESVPLTN
ncbi:unnamed protein product [Coffea canephora]|uniref:Uncharacterized protein n=1 Tax=Coffea canephora TaxID=49390 RepID=A0A068UHY1_COFCA|nr:unnamed protein product [Coffea canephora]